jgi:Na+/proline symporter
MSSGSANTAVRSCYIAAGLYLTVAMLPLFISLCTRQLYPGQIGDPQLALPQMVIQHTGMIVQVLFFGSLLSAIMSTTSSAMLAPASIIAENLIRPLSGKVYTDKQMLLLTRLSLLGFSVVATVMACLRENIYELVGESSILSLVSLFIPLTMGLYWSRANSAGAILSMLAGSITWFVCEWMDIKMPSLVPATLASLAAMLIGTWVFPAKQVARQ